MKWRTGRLLHFQYYFQNSAIHSGSALTSLSLILDPWGTNVFAASFYVMSSTKRRAPKDPIPNKLDRGDSDLSDRSEDSDGEGGPDQRSSQLELPPTHDRRHPKHQEDSNVIVSSVAKFKQNYPFNQKAIPSLLSRESPFHNYRGFLHLSGLILVRQ